MVPFLRFVDLVLNMYIYVLIASVIMSWLIGFNVINGYNPFVRSIWQALTAVTDPVLRPIRRMLPDMGGIDISPIILWLAIMFIQMVVIWGWLIPAFS